MTKRNSNQIPLLAKGQVWTPREGLGLRGRAQSRTLVWVGKNEAPAFIRELRIDGPTIGYVANTAKPGYPETGHDSWLEEHSFIAWIRKHKAVCTNPVADVVEVPDAKDDPQEASQPKSAIG
jgi:hypothetical protein